SFADYTVISTRRVPVDIMTFLRGLTADRNLTTDDERLFATENMVWVLEEGGVDLMLSTSLVNYTVFVPIDAAGLNLPQEIIECAIRNPASIRPLILNHIVLGRFDPNQLARANTLFTMAGTRLTFAPTGEGDGFFVNSVRVENTLGYSTLNGNVYLIDEVLIPAEFEERYCVVG
ncbi:MAG: fasciclin domain-containing protein, partial [Anaerolineae bacterium]|nr:fasciclin domain-containing protein [Anaerolineae bacterium]